MPDGYEISGDLSSHGGQLDAVRDQLQLALDAAKAVSMPTDAYGILCQPFRMMLDPVEQFGMDAITKAMESMESMAQGVRATARVYDAQDQNVATLYEGMPDA
ncbi:MAG: type VII secretion target [Kibdelosporangium sp.]